MRTCLRSKSLATLVWLAVPLFCAAQIFAAIEPDFLMDSDPDLDVPQPVQNFEPAAKALWLAALERPEIDMQRMAAETIARAHQHGIPDLIEAVPRLESILTADASHPAARFAAARALIVLESRRSSEKLFEASQAFGADLRQLIEPALADWDFGPARTMWIERLDESESRPRDLVLAIRGLGRVREQSALTQLLAMTGDMTRDPDIRLAAATAAGQIADTGLERDAERLAQKARTPQFVNQLCAIRLLARHRSDGAQQLLIKLAGHAEPVVAAAALGRLNDIDPALVVPLAESAMESPDPHVRLQGATSYLNVPTADRMAPLSQLLADPHPGIRGEVCEGLFHLSEIPELAEPIRAAAVQVLAGDGWQGQAQAALLLGALEYKPAADRFVELLESPRVEVMVAAAWGLRKVAVPETIPALIDQAQQQTQRRQQVEVPGAEEQIVHLFEALGVMKSADSLPLLRQYIPKRSAMEERSRSAAVWAIGRIKAGTRDPELEDAFYDRITDFPEKNPESPLVKQMCAIALVRMNAVDQAPMMREIAETQVIPLRLGVALRWAFNKLTGAEMPPPEPPIVSPENWFLEPVL